MDQAPPSASLHDLIGALRRIKVVDIGADPIDGAPPYAGLLRAGRADVVGFEPNPAALARLLAMKGPHETDLPHAVADGGRHMLNTCQAPGTTSLLRPDPAVLGTHRSTSSSTCWRSTTGDAAPGSAKPTWRASRRALRVPGRRRHQPTAGQHRGRHRPHHHAALTGGV